MFHERRLRMSMDAVTCAICDEEPAPPDSVVVVCVEMGNQATVGDLIYWLAYGNKIDYFIT